MNPALLPRVESSAKTDDGATLELQVEKSNPCFDGHFDGFPLTPGVIQLGWVIHFASQTLGLGQPKPPQSAIKFQLPLFPDDKFSLRLDWQADSRRLNYRLTSPAGQQHASGRLQY